ncbi:MAG: hypothetical protein ABSD85_16565 [Acidimicrobiales bacterium]|jgi:hypothetical protein
MVGWAAFPNAAARFVNLSDLGTADVVTALWDFKAATGAVRACNCPPAWDVAPDAPEKTEEFRTAASATAKTSPPARARLR